MRRLVLLAVARGGARAPGTGGRAPARQLHHQPLQPRRGARARGSTSATCWTWPRSRPSRPDASTLHAYARRIAPERAPRRRRAAGVTSSRSGPRSRTRSAPAACTRHGSRSSSPGPMLAGAASVAYRDDELLRTGSGGRRSWSAPIRTARATSSAPTRRTFSRARSTPPPSPPARARRRARRRTERSRAATSLAGARPGRRRRLRLARRPLAPERSGHPRLARGGALLGSGARALSGSRQDDRDRVPGRAARHSATRRAAGPDRHDHAHDRRLRARARDPGALAVRRPRPPLPVAEPRLGPARGRDRRVGLLGTVAASPRACPRPPPPSPRTRPGV